MVCLGAVCRFLRLLSDGIFWFFLGFCLCLPVVNGLVVVWNCDGVLGSRAILLLLIVFCRCFGVFPFRVVCGWLFECVVLLWVFVLTVVLLLVVLCFLILLRLCGAWIGCVVWWFSVSF